MVSAALREQVEFVKHDMWHLPLVYPLLGSWFLL